ncbi:unnamed protein product [Brugia pahangi]|uniref:Secreted protein n=1 Tax=Brugia pahangi TaxID=6280 RepID=A0A0N4T801_BRUPA|nr:unnamed protein product [Brugia pahangi]
MSSLVATSCCLTTTGIWRYLPPFKFGATCYYLKLPTTTCNHLLTPATACYNLQPLVETYCYLLHLRTPATIRYLLPPAMPPATTS